MIVYLVLTMRIHYIFMDITGKKKESQKINTKAFKIYPIIFQLNPKKKKKLKNKDALYRYSHCPLDCYLPHLKS